MRDMHSNQETCYYCSECGILKATRKQLQNHQRSHKTSVCPSCGKVLPLWNKHKHVKSCQGQVHGQRFHCDQCGKATKTSNGMEQHMIWTYMLYARKFGWILTFGFDTKRLVVFFLICDDNFIYQWWWICFLTEIPIRTDIKTVRGQGPWDRGDTGLWLLEVGSGKYFQVITYRHSSLDCVTSPAEHTDCI